MCCGHLSLGAFRGQEPGRVRVQQLPLGGREVLVDRRSNNGVDEVQRLTRRKDRGVRQGLRQRAGLAHVDPGEPRGSSDARVGAQHRNRPGECRGAVSETPDAEQERCGDAFRNPLPDRFGVDRGRGRSVEAEAGEQLRQQEGVAAGRLCARGAELVRSFFVQAVAHKRSNTLVAERRRAQHRRGRLELESLDEVRGHGGLSGPGGNGNGHWEPLKPPCQIDQEAHRRAVGPMQVVDRKQQGRTLGEVGNEPIQAM